jgi:hypothetical protein
LEFDHSSWAHVTDANPRLSDPNFGFVKNIKREFRAGNFLVPKILSSDVRREIVLLASALVSLNLPKLERTTGGPDAGQTITCAGGSFALATAKRTKPMHQIAILCGRMNLPRRIV